MTLLTPLLLFLTAGATTSPPQAVVTADREELMRVVGELNAGFVCPQFLSSQGARQQEIESFSMALAELGLSYDDALKVRRAMLGHHHCIARSDGSA